jgi:hypothetical protein
MRSDHLTRHVRVNCGTSLNKQPQIHSTSALIDDEARIKMLGKSAAPRVMGNSCATNGSNGPLQDITNTIFN